MAVGRSGCDGTMNTINSCHSSVERDGAFLAFGTLLFIASAAVTISSSRSMSGGMAMPGGWTMSMAWMKMPGQTSVAAVFSFMEMWVAMMAAMMLPALIPAMLRYRVSLRRPEALHLNLRTTLAGAGYFFVWTLLGAVVYPAGILLTNAEMQLPALARSVPLVTGAVLIFAGSLQFTPWKMRQLSRCREEVDCVPTTTSGARQAWRHGLRLGAHCLSCCLGLMAVLLVTGVMNLGAMAALTVAITVERLAPRPALVSRMIGVAIVAAAILMIVVNIS